MSFASQMFQVFHLKKELSALIELYSGGQNYMNPHHRLSTSIFLNTQAHTKPKELNLHLHNRFKLIWDSKERFLFLHLKHYKWQISTPQ